MKNFLKRKAIEFANKYGIYGEYPVDAAFICKKMNIKLHTYESFCNSAHISVVSLIEKCDADAFVFYSSQYKTFAICYNEKSQPKYVRWNVMHEIAHIYLHHVGPSEKFYCCDEIRETKEKEAQIFTSFVLCPSEFKKNNINFDIPFEFYVEF